MNLLRDRRWPLALLLILLATVPAGAQSVFPGSDWQVDKPENQSMCAAVLEKVGEWLKDNGSKTGLVVRHGRIVGEWYFDEAKPDSKYIVYSTTKSFASTAAGLAIAAGKLKLDSKVGDFFPDATPSEKREITVRQLLSMTSGAHNDNGDLDKRRPVSIRALRVADGLRRRATKWDYNNSGLSLLGPVVQKATGKNIGRAARRAGVSQDRHPARRLDLGRARRDADPLLGLAHHGPQPGPIRPVVSEPRTMARPTRSSRPIG